MARTLFDLDGQVVLVAGGTGGIGRTMAETLIEYGAKVAVSGRSEEKAAQVSKELSAGGSKVLGLSSTANDVASIQALVDRTVDEFGRIDHLVDCIGGNARHEAEDFPESDWDRILDLNLKSAFFLSQAAARHMIKQGKQPGRNVAGKILHVSSVRSQLGIRAGYVAYCTAKGGLNLMVKQLATEWAEFGILVNAIAPTFIRTEQVADMLSDQNFYNSLVQRIPLNRVGETSDLVGATLFFLSGASDFVTGQVLFIDGGVTATQ